MLTALAALALFSVAPAGQPTNAKAIATQTGIQEMRQFHATLDAETFNGRLP